MIWEIFWHNVYRRPVRKLMAFFILWISTTLIATLLISAIAADRDVQQRLQHFGANFVITSGQDLNSRLHLGDWQKAFRIFWRNNISAVIPVDYDRVQWLEGNRWLPVAWTWFDRTEKTSTGREVPLGWRDLAGGWRIEGSWPEEVNDVMVGSVLARRFNLHLGMKMRLKIRNGEKIVTVYVRAIFESGGVEDRYVLGDFRLSGEPAPERPIDRFYLRAQVMPEPSIPVQFEQLSPEEQEKWLCRPYPTSIRYQLTGVFAGATVRPLQDVLYQEKMYFLNFRKIIVLLAGVVTLAMTAGMMLIMVHLVQSRAREMMLFTALGSGTGTVMMLFLLEAVVMGLIAGICGWLSGGFFVQYLFPNLHAGPPWAYPEIALLIIPGVTVIAIATTIVAVRYRWRRLSPQLLHQVG